MLNRRKIDEKTIGFEDFDYPNRAKVGDKFAVPMGIAMSHHVANVVVTKERIENGRWYLEAEIV